jgi:hypothetical protein
MGDEFDGNFNSCYQATFPGYTQVWMELVRFRNHLGRGVHDRRSSHSI